MATQHAFTHLSALSRNEDLSDLVVRSDLEHEVLVLLRRLDEEGQVGALLILRAIERRLRLGRGPARRK
jgi:hypothetical protein